MGCCNQIYYCVGGLIVAQDVGLPPLNYSGGPWATFADADVGCPLTFPCCTPPSIIPRTFQFNFVNKTGDAVCLPNTLLLPKSTTSGWIGNTTACRTDRHFLGLFCVVMGAEPVVSLGIDYAAGMYRFVRPTSPWVQISGQISQAKISGACPNPLVLPSMVGGWDFYATGSAVPTGAFDLVVS